MDLERRFLVLGLNSDENTEGAEERRLSACRDAVLTDRTVVDFQEIVGYRNQIKIQGPSQGQGQGWEEDRVGTGAGVGGSSAEVCRVFLACLMLANSGNLDLIQPASIVEKKSLKGGREDKNTIKDVFQSANKDRNHIHNNKKMSFQVRLLNGKRNLDVEEFRAPSIDSRS